MPRSIEVTELVLRDGHQSLLATRMALEDMVSICAEIDQAGYWSVECWGGATYDACIRFLNAELARLHERVAALEAAAATTPPAPAPAPAATPQPQPAPQVEGLSEELVPVIAAAIAAFLGRRAHIRQIRLLGSASWAAHGRVTIQASHASSTHHR